MQRRDFLSAVATSVAAAVAMPTRAAQRATRPNIVLILAEDIGPQLGCYGSHAARTPNLDRLAAEGLRFTRVFTTAPVCSPSRSSLMTGMYATSIASHNHRTAFKKPLPSGVQPLTAHLRAAGYFTANLGATTRDGKKSYAGEVSIGSGKTDLNFETVDLFDGSDWNQRAPAQPFFAQVTLAESHRGPHWEEARKQAVLTDPAVVEIPPYYPDHPVVRSDLASYFDGIALMDQRVGAVLERLGREGLTESTVVVFMGDNGQCLVRGKQFLYDGGIHVPLIIRRPGKLAPATDERLVTGNDIAPTILGLAGLATPRHMQGQDLFAAAYKEPEQVIAVRDRCDIAVDRMRCVRTKRYKYIRNYVPATPYMQLNPYMERSYPVWTLLKELHREGKLNATQALFLADRKPLEELYDLDADPHEVSNLAGSAAHHALRDDMRRRLDDWSRACGDDGAAMEDPLVVFQSYFGTTDPAQVQAKDRAAVAQRAYLGSAHARD